MLNKVLPAIILAVLLSGCAGQMATTSSAMKFNMDVVDNRYARGGVTILMAPVYAITTIADYGVFNPIEFWTGTNVLTKKSSIYDAKGKNYIEINDDLHDSLKKAPITLD
ncbi:DUF3332 family protein [Shewanella sp. VB17]|uniref:DUF3332 family protein n=1 Tax=Shewanella sp. VB17 TaxID=2739432 RepID=UPI0015665977|nr:DUF3332 family protein [Shewanella sp. VB17]NRD75777.1 DUF3332 family protein [Shewanella sp. VB17]